MSRKSEFKLPPISPLVGSSRSLIREVFKGQNIDPKYKFKVRVTLILVTVTSAFHWIDNLWFRKKLRKFVFKAPPLFVIGHWRSGTTFLHNMLTKDPDAAYSTTYQCVFPDNMKSKWLFKTFMRIFMPRVRPGDNLEISASFPQEDEYGMSNLTHHSYYHTFYFPSSYQSLYRDSIRFDTLSEEEKEDWKNLYRQLVIKAIMNSGGSRIVLKNPANTGRMLTLLELFPEAKFVHIIRNPVIVYLSTKKFFSQLYPIVNLEIFTDDEISEMVLDVYENLMKDYLEDLKQVDPDRHLEIRYEDLVEKPIENLEIIYSKFNYSNFQQLKPVFENYLDSIGDHKIDSYTMDQQELDRVMEHVGFAMEHWSYKQPDNLRII